MKLVGSILAGAAALFATSANAEVYMKETFEDAEWESRWTVGTEWKPTSETGEWKWMTPELQEDNKAIQTGEDARFYSLTAPLDAEINNEGKDLIISYTVKHEQNLDCGGAYIKLVPPGFEASKFGGDTPYSVMFGPDICGTSTRRTHAIFTYKGENLLTKRTIKCETDQQSHRYTLIVRPDNTYDVKIDGKSEATGSLLDDWDFLPPKQIQDPAQSKPKDWVDDAKIPDPEAVKPDGWDNEPAQIPDSDAEQPEDWDEEEDGEWEPPMVDNPEYKGEWKAPMIDNPDYVGPWVHPMIDNPEYKEDDAVYNVCAPCSHVGFELWQVKAGTTFDDIFVGDNEAELEAFEKETWEVKKAAERKAHEAKQAADAEAAAAAAKKAEEDAAAAADEDEDEDEEDEEEL